jgi:hypothetical protein
MSVWSTKGPVSPCSEEVSYTQGYNRSTDSFPGFKSGTAFAVRKDIPHNHVDLLPLAFVQATRVCIPIRHSEVLLAPGVAQTSLRS